MNDTLDITIGPRKRTVVTILCDDNFIRNIFQIRKLTFYYFNRMSFGAKTWLEQVSVNFTNSYSCALKHIIKTTSY